MIFCNIMKEKIMRNIIIKVLTQSSLYAAVSLLLFFGGEVCAQCNDANGNAWTVKFYENNTSWSAAAELVSPHGHLFTLSDVTGIEVHGVPNCTVQAKIWSSDDSAHTKTITLSPSSASASVYRNSGDGAWPLWGGSYSSSYRRLKNVDESGTLIVQLIVNGVTLPICAPSEKIDLAEIAVVDGTPSDDAWTLYLELYNSFYGIKSDTDGDGSTCVEYGAKADFLNVSGHSHLPTVGVTGESGYGLASDNFDPSDIGNSWNNGELEWCLLAVCSQVHVNENSPSTSDFGIKWIKAMPKVHALLGYQNIAPSGGVDSQIATDFVQNMADDHIHIAWMLANRPDSSTCPGINATALVNVNNLEDKMGELGKFATKDETGNQYRYFWIEREGNFLTGYTYRIVYKTITLP